MVDFRRAVDQQLLLIVLLAEEVELKGRTVECVCERERDSHFIYSQKKQTEAMKVQQMVCVC